MSGEPLELPDIVDRLKALWNQALALEMAILGSVSICSEERDALDHAGEALVNEIRGLHSALDDAHRRGNDQ